MTPVAAATDALFATRDPVVREIYDRLLSKLAPLGPFEVEPKKTCLHLANGVAFLGIHPMKSKLRLTIKSETPIESPRVYKTEQASKRRCHNEVALTTPAEVDRELLGWIRASYRMGQ